MSRNRKSYPHALQKSPIFLPVRLIIVDFLPFRRTESACQVGTARICRRTPNNLGGEIASCLGILCGQPSEIRGNCPRDVRKGGTNVGVVRVELDRSAHPMAESPPLSLDRNAGREHHYLQGQAWLDFSDSGQHSSPLAYAAFEFRLTIERLILELLVRIRGDQLDPTDEKILSSFKKIENRIYELEGHQRHLDRKIDFINIVINQAGGSIKIAKINLGELSSHWHECSGLCHITWNLSVTGPDMSIRRNAFQTLIVIRDSLQAKLSSFIGWPQLHEPWFLELQNAYVQGTVNDEDVRSRLRETGVWRCAGSSPMALRSLATITCPFYCLGRMV